MRRTVLAALPPAAAIFVFGVIYGSLARPELGVTATVLSSLLIFSGSVQFTLVALVTSGAGAGALVLNATTLNLRNLVLGAVMRTRVDRSSPARAGIGWFLTDEAAGLALASEEDSARVLVVAGGLFYVSWQIGTALGLLGASVEALQEAASAVFPVLFVGLSAAVCPSWSVGLRAAVAAVLVAGASWWWPGSQGFAAVIAAVLVSLPDDAR
ncbi:MAG TPA: AzlC family ABC transporter permease [Actinomycetota bacterium]|nr:AzlC family ABC transporter permease [Actinomycetota bacterium]